MKPVEGHVETVLPDEPSSDGLLPWLGFAITPTSLPCAPEARAPSGLGQASAAEEVPVAN
jgi:hypothetical protein